MTEALARHTGVAADAAPAAPPPVVVVKSQSGSTTLAYSNNLVGGIRMAGFVLAGMTGGVMLVHWVRGSGITPSVVGIIVAQSAFFALLVIPGMIRRRRQWREDWRIHTQTPLDPDDRSSVVRGALLEVGGLCRYHWLTGRADQRWRHRFQELLRSAGLPPALVILQHEVSNPVQAIPLDDAFVEPERMLGGMSRRSRQYWIQVVFVLFFLWLMISSAMRGDFIVTACLAVGVAAFGVQLLRAHGVHVSEARAPVLGMGVYSDWKGRRWSILDSTVYIYSMRVGLNDMVAAELVGPEGHTIVPFQGLDDPALKMFWQRWMHPHPRPDLV
ncbi:MAG: hypothetical protein IT430_08765 [Phycisphaerales bacterium]|nr:hypothetical protein [Phycisphaerales bacterium]